MTTWLAAAEPLQREAWPTSAPADEESWAESPHRELASEDEAAERIYATPDVAVERDSGSPRPPESVYEALDQHWGETEAQAVYDEGLTEAGQEWAEIEDPQQEQRSGAGSTRGGRLCVTRHPLLRAHAGTRPDLILRWNAMTQPAALDVVVHLHGYSDMAGAMRLDRHKEPMSGLDFHKPGSPSSVGRTRATLAVLPRGSWGGAQPGKRRDRYLFPALVRRGATQALIDDGVGRFAAATGVTAPRGRLMLTAHSGGGAALLAILAHTDLDPDEVHIFDGLYQDPKHLIAWARRHIAAEAGSSSPGSTGALRVLCRPGTRTALQSAKVQRALAVALRGVPDSGIAKRYRVESTPVGHNEIPRRYGWRLLLDASADLPDTSPQLGGAQRTSREHEVMAGAEGAGEDEGFEAEEFARHADYEELQGEAWDQEALVWTDEWEQDASPAELVAGEAVTPAVRPRVLRTAMLRRAWSQYACATRRMVPLTLFGRWTTPVNPETVAAWRALEQALAASGYRVHRAWVFNCRSIKDRANLSLHAYGLAIDIDHAQPRCNVNNRTPDGRAVRFSSAATKEERCRDVQRGVADTSFTPDQVAAVEAIQTVDGYQVFTWGGRWRTTKDTMHFQLNVTPAELAPGIRTDSVRATTASGSAATASPTPTPRRPVPQVPQGERGAAAAVPARSVDG